MSLKKCKECGNDVSTEAAVCPKCGAAQKKDVKGKKNEETAGSILGGIIVLVVIFYFGFFDGCFGDSSDSSSGSDAKVEKKISYNEKQKVKIGYMSYTVWKTYWSNSSGSVFDKAPNASYLFVNITVKNRDKKNRSIPSFKLIDENGSEYDSSSVYNESAIDLFDSLNPSVSKQGYVIFDVPRGHKYRLVVGGGFWNTKEAHIRLLPNRN